MATAFVVLYNRLSLRSEHGDDPMAEDNDSVSEWVEQLKEGEHDAAQKLWQRYFPRLVGLARQQLQDTPRRAADEEDVALEVLATVCRRVEEGRFPQLNDRDDLWRLLVTVTVRKANWQRRHEGRGKRRGARNAAGILEEVAGSEPTPEDAALVADECRRLFRSLDDPDLEAVAQAKLEGFTNPETAARLGRSLRSVERMLEMIRDIWRENPS
jgi:DNA-directed RNA polymerase specialized sigma24 family protein